MNVVEYRISFGFQWKQIPFPTRSSCMHLLVRPYTRITNFGYQSIRNKTVINWNSIVTLLNHDCK